MDKKFFWLLFFVAAAVMFLSISIGLYFQKKRHHETVEFEMNRRKQLNECLGKVQDYRANVIRSCYSQPAEPGFKDDCLKQEPALTEKKDADCHYIYQKDNKPVKLEEIFDEISE